MTHLMMILTFLITCVIAEVLGYFVHRLAHNPKTGLLYKSHMAHHQKIYPPSRYLSKFYQPAGKDSFTLYFAPLFILLVVGFFLVLPWKLALCSLAGLVLISFINDYVHDQFHVFGTWLEKFNVFHKLRYVHYVHHVTMKYNFGIWSNLTDFLLSTYKEFSYLDLEEVVNQGILLKSTGELGHEEPSE